MVASPGYEGKVQGVTRAPLPRGGGRTIPVDQLSLLAWPWLAALLSLAG